MRCETDLERIRRLAEEREDENFAFRSYLKGRGGPKLDARVRRILERVTADIDCAECGNCCQSLRPTVSRRDVTRLAETLPMTAAEVRKEYVETNDCGELCLRGGPCPFLNGKTCSVYDHRPENCRSFPHLHKKHFTTRLFGVIGNYGLCPIVFNVYERLKAEMGWRWRR